MRLFKFCLLTLFTCLQLTACDKGYQYPPLPATANVLILGDSLTYGTGAAEGEDYATLLASNTGWNVMNAGVPGSTSLEGLERLPEYLAVHASGEQKIDFLLIALGGNDFLRRVPQSLIVENLKAMLMLAKAHDIQTALIAMPELSPVGAAFGTLSDHLLYARLAEETNTPLLSGIFTEALAQNSLKADPIHPNADGYQVVASRLQQGLQQLGFMRR
jgi:acyl-CoA hydrolase